MVSLKKLTFHRSVILINRLLPTFLQSLNPFWPYFFVKRPYLILLTSRISEKNHALYLIIIYDGKITP